MARLCLFHWLPSCTSVTTDDNGLRRRAIHRPGDGMETLPSLTITGSRRARNGNRRASHGVVDSMGSGDVVDLTTDSGVEDEDVVDITDQVGVFPAGNKCTIKHIGFSFTCFNLWTFVLFSYVAFSMYTLLSLVSSATQIVCWRNAYIYI